MVKNILYPTDLGLYGTYVLQHVMELAEHYDANVMVIHVVEPLGVFADAVLETYVPPDMIGELRAYGMPAVMEAIRQQVIEAFEDEVMDCSADVSRIIDVQVLRGTPSDVILEQCKRIQADMVIMGSHCNESDHPSLLGSTVSKVLQLANVPVYMIPIAYTQECAKKMATIPLSRS